MTETHYPTEPNFFAIFPDGGCISNYNLADLSQTPMVSHFVKVVFLSYNIRKFTIINPDGTPKWLKIGNFELRDISHEGYNSNLKKHVAQVTLYDIKESENREFLIITNMSAEHMMKELLGLYKQLEEAGSYNAYLKLGQISELEGQVQELKQENQKLKDRVKELESSQTNSI